VPKRRDEIVVASVSYTLLFACSAFPLSPLRFGHRSFGGAKFRKSFDRLMANIQAIVAAATAVITKSSVAV
jgi:hypothetical protein